MLAPHTLKLLVSSLQVVVIGWYWVESVFTPNPWVTLHLIIRSNTRFLHVISKLVAHTDSLSHTHKHTYILTHTLPIHLEKQNVFHSFSVPMNDGFVLLRHLKPPSLPPSSLPLPHPSCCDLSQNSGCWGGLELCKDYS